MRRFSRDRGPARSEPVSEDLIALYARVSSPIHRDDLKRQQRALRAFAESRKLGPCVEINEIGGGLHRENSKLVRLLSNPKIRSIIVEHKDRLIRFGYEYIEAALRAQRRSIIVLSYESRGFDLEDDFKDLTISICAQLYGDASAERRAARALQAAGDGS